MAAKTPIINFSLKCTECNNRNYYKTKNRNFKNKIELKKSIVQSVVNIPYMLNQRFNFDFGTYFKK